MQVKKPSENIPVRYLKGVGPRKAEIFRKIGIENINDLFYYLPRRYEDRSEIVGVKDLRPGDTKAVVGRVLKTNVFRAATGTVIFEAAIGDEKSRIFAVWYNQPYIKKLFTVGQTVMLYGKVELQKRLQIVHPTFEILEEGSDKASLDIGRIVPIYSLTENLTQKYLRKTVHAALTGHAAQSNDLLPTVIRARRKLVDLRFAVENIHFPHSTDNLERAYRRLVFEEFFILQVVMAMRRRKNAVKGIKHTVREGLQTDFEQLFAFELTEDQKKCIRDIEKDMAGEKPMYRLLQGDVGSGKTVVAMYALLLSVQSGHQAAMMVPTEILARQHYVTVSKTFMPLGLDVRLLVNGMDQRDRDEIRREIARGDVDIVIGTHSLFQEGVEYEDLGLVVIDEQHKFGVEQRKAMAMKGKTPDVLVMTATPIPRSLALTVYGDMDVSILKGKPLERGEVTTYWVGEEKRELVYGFIKGELEEGRQAFLVYPRIKDDASSDLRSAEEMYADLKNGAFKDYKVALVHGRMKPDDKNRIMEDFLDKKYDVLIATTVIEVGVDVPNVTVMLVEHADRYGLAQLHQLRGRIGRGKHQSYCILLGEAKTEDSHERLSTMMETADGFEIAEKDLDLRGPGEFLGTRQSGIPELRFGNIVRDFKIMEEAREEAFSLVQEDPKLSDARHAGIRQAIVERFKGKVGI
jgi:ATP-dependent DNA helicase RecG